MMNDFRPGMRVRITEQNSQTNLGTGTVVTLVRPHTSGEDVWLVDSRPDEGQTVTQRGSTGGRYRWAMTSILSAPIPTEENTMTTTALPVGTRVRVLDVRPNTHNLQVGSVATIDSADPSTPSVTGPRRTGTGTTVQWLMSDQFEVYNEAEAPFPVGSIARVTSNSNGTLYRQGEQVEVVGGADVIRDRTDVVVVKRGDRARQIIRTEHLEPVVTETVSGVTTTTVEAITAERDAAIQALADFKRKVALVAGREATKRGWCTQIDDVLASIDPDLKRAATRTRVTRTIEVVIDLPEDGEHSTYCLRREPLLALDSLLVNQEDIDGSTLVSARWAGDATSEEVEADAAQPLTAADITRHGRYLVLEGAARANGADYNLPTVGDIITARVSGVDSDGEVETADGLYVLPQYLARA